MPIGNRIGSSRAVELTSSLYLKGRVRVILDPPTMVVGSPDGSGLAAGPKGEGDGGAGGFAVGFEAEPGDGGFGGGMTAGFR